MAEIEKVVANLTLICVSKNGDKVLLNKAHCTTTVVCRCSAWAQALTEN